MNSDDRLRAAAEEYAFAGDDPAKLPDITHAVLSSARDGFIAGAKYERDRAEVLLEALEWYGWKMVPDAMNSGDTEITTELGKRARQAIAAYRGGKSGV